MTFHKIGEKGLIRLKFDVVQALKDNGYNTTKMRKEKIIGENNLTSLRRGEMPNITVLNTVCAILKMQPGDVVEFTATDDEKIKYY